MTEQATIIDRYQDYRTARFLKRERIWSHALPNWRSQQRRRLLVVVLIATFAAMAIIGLLSAVGFKQAVLLWIPACLVFFPTWIALQVVSGRRGDAPRGALDEYEIAQRNAARSIGLTLTQYLMLIPVFYLIIGAVEFPSPNVAYAGGLMVTTALLIGGCAPAMILGWVRPDPEPEDRAG